MKHMKKTAVFIVLLLLFSITLSVFAVETDEAAPAEETVPETDAETLPETGEEEAPGNDLPSVRISGPAAACAGETLTLNVFLDGTERFLRGIQTEPEYDASELFISEISGSVDWKLGTGALILLTDENLDRPVTAEVHILTLKLVLKEGLEPGTVVSFSLKDSVVTDWEDVSLAETADDIAIGDALYTVEILPPRSDDATLRSLSVAEGTLSPAFQPGILRYEVTVPYSVRYATVNARPNDEKAAVRVTGNTLQVGSNTVTVTVTSESGVMWVYKITVVRQQDPAYVPDPDASLADIRLSEGTVSPKPDGKNKTFVVYLPYECGKLTITPVPASKKAAGLSVSAELTVGINEVPFTVRAEDGTEAEYLLYAVRHPAFEEIGDIPIYVPETEPETEAETEPETEPVTETVPVTEPETPPVTEAPDTPAPDTDPPVPPESKKSGISALWLLPAVLLSFAAGCGICSFTQKQRKSRKKG